MSTFEHKTETRTFNGTMITGAAANFPVKATTYTTDISKAIVTTSADYTLVTYTSFPPFVSPGAGQCQISVVVLGGGARVLYWPTPTPQPPVKSVVDADGFSLYVLPSRGVSDGDNSPLCSISPSVYVLFSSLSPADNCGVVGSLQPNFTTSFAQYELSMLAGDIMSATYLTLPFNYADLNDCFTSLVTVTYTLDTTEEFTTVMPDWETPSVYGSWISKYYRSSPEIIMEEWTTKLDHAWTSCTAASN